MSAGIDAATQRTLSMERVATNVGVPTPRSTEVANQLQSGDDVFLRSRDPRFSGQLALLPLLARVPAPLLVSGEPGTGRRCLARHVARLAGHSIANSITECSAPQNAVIELDALIRTSDDVERRLEDLRCATLAPIDATGASTGIHCGNRPEGEALAQPGASRAGPRQGLLIFDVQLLSPRAQATLLTLCDAGNRAIARVRMRCAEASERTQAWHIVSTADDRLEEHARAGTFDSRLLAHLGAITVRMPRLRERGGDIVPLAMLFLQRECEQTARPLPVLTPGAVNRLLAHSWHGNVPELHAVMRAALACCRKNSITGDDIRLGNASRRADPAVVSLRESKRQLVLRFERAVLENLLQASQGNIAKAARLAQKNRRAFFELMRKHGIDAARFREPGLPRSEGAIEIGARPACI